MKVYVHLEYGLDVKRWSARHARGEVPSRYPYGYQYIADFGHDVSFSKDHDETQRMHRFRIFLLKYLSFDAVHAWRNWSRAKQADCIWTHTEREHLAILAMIRLFPFGHRPKVMAESIWLYDRWHKYSVITRIVYRWLLKKSSVLLVQTQSNYERAATLFPGSRIERVPFGISLEDFPMESAVPAHDHGPLRILSLGNDVHRDWDTVWQSFGNQEAFAVTVAARRLPEGQIGSMTNVTNIHPASVAAIRALYRGAHVVVICTVPNRHASGTTVLLEAITQGVPVVCTDSDGLRDYFPDDGVVYVPPHDPDALRNAVLSLCASQATLADAVRRAQARFLELDLSNKGYVSRYCAIMDSLFATTSDRGGSSWRR